MLEPCLKAMDLLNSALGLHEDMRNGTKPVPLQGGAGAQGMASAGGRDGRPGGGGGGPPRLGGEHRGFEELRDFLAPGDAGVPPPDGATAGGVRGAVGMGSGSGSSSAASLRLYKLPAVREACGGFDPKRCIGEGGFGKVRRGDGVG